MELTLTITGTQGEAGVIADVIRGLQGKVTDMTLGVSKVEKVVHAQATVSPLGQPGAVSANNPLLDTTDYQGRNTPAPEGAKRRGRPAKTLESVRAETQQRQATIDTDTPGDPSFNAIADNEEDWLTLQDFRSQAVQWLKANPHLNAHATDVFTKHVGTNSGQLQDVPQSARRQFLADLQAIAPAPNGEAPSWG